MEFHVSRKARDRYGFDQGLFAYNGRVIFANFHAARIFAQLINQKLDLLHYPEKAVKASYINALGLIDEILHSLIEAYRKQVNSQSFNEALVWLETHLGTKEVDRTLRDFCVDFPSVSLYQKQLTIDEYLMGETDGRSNREIALEEMVLLWVTNSNPAANQFKELFDDSRLANETPYLRAIAEIYKYFDTQPPFGPDNQNLIDVLRAPALKEPNSLFAQLEYIRQRWSSLLGEFLYRLLGSLDFIREDEKAAFFGPGPIPIPVYDAAAISSLGEAERFSQDREWMPRLVLIAKNSYVWLDQLTKKYNRPITRLDQIPDEELDTLARRGVTGLWLIGLWERSKASAIIKQWCGNPEAISSAYSLADYSIAQDLGGENAYERLRDQAWQRGIRLASDMVPNHMGIDSSWVIEHPDWFVSSPESPFPSYSFTGASLSPVGSVGIYLEDHYFSRSDAAVVFKRVDFNTGDTRFIYHGNDGTSMPWNDTAQLNYLNPQVREAVIQTILSVARKFPIIRFDAAMTLAKRHYQRLWFPEPGSGGDIASRAEHGMTKAQFEAAFPEEFWREVVDRVAVEAPDTLLLAEAFWLMEGYFVRTLGMHRVYNSAFMNLLRNEDNQNYRSLIKNTLEFDPEILKRYVNFMNNPDERTAVEQFGKGDKYFGICTMMATLPGLPMLGHGQIEGFAEKYGMEYRRAYWDEIPDPYLVARHEREIFPLFHKRPVFAGVENFLLYDFFTDDGSVNENVFAYSNRQNDERGLVIYHNKYAPTQGWIRTSVGFINKSSEDRSIISKTLGEGLNLHPGPDNYVIFRDLVSGQEYIRSVQEIWENGIFIELGAYQRFVFTDFHEVHDDMWQSYRHLNGYLNGRGVPSIENAVKELLLQPVQTPFRQIANQGYFNFLLEQRTDAKNPSVDPHVLNEAQDKMASLLNGIQYITGLFSDHDTILLQLREALKTALDLKYLDKQYPLPGSRKYAQAVRFISDGLEKEHRWLALLTWTFIRPMGMTTVGNDLIQAQSWFDEWQFGRILQSAYQSMGIKEETAWNMVRSLRLMLGKQHWLDQMEDLTLPEIMERWISDEEIQRFIGVNRYKDILWFKKESFETLLWFLYSASLLDTVTKPRVTATEVVETTLTAYRLVEDAIAAMEKSDYQVQKLLDAAADQSIA